MEQQIDLSKKGTCWEDVGKLEPAHTTDWKKGLAVPQMVNGVTAREDASRRDELRRVGTENQALQVKESAPWCAF